MKKIHMTIKVSTGTRFNINSVEYDPKKVIKEEIRWSSVTPEIASIDSSTGEVIAVTQGVGTICATNEKGRIRVYCTIIVEAEEGTSAQAMATSTASKNLSIANSSIQPLALTYSSDCNNVSAVGYTGKTFSYTQTGNSVTLECGWRTKNGTQDAYSSCFRSDLVEMNNISDSLTYDQRRAWAELRARGFLTQVAIFISPTPTAVARKLALQILLNAGIDLGSLFEATINDMYAWYAVEQDAESDFDAFE